MSIKIKIKIPPVNQNPSDHDVRFLEDRVTEYNVQRTGIKDGKTLSYLVREEDGTIIGGLYGRTWGGCCEVRDLWVRWDYRKQGYGKGLMAAAQSEAIARGCRQMVMDIYSFQAPDFFQSLGFELVATQADYPPGHQKQHLRKALPES